MVAKALVSFNEELKGAGTRGWQEQDTVSFNEELKGCKFNNPVKLSAVSFNEELKVTVTAPYCICPAYPLMRN